MRDISAIETYLQGAVGLEPILVVELDLSFLDNPAWYAKKTFTGTWPVIPTLESLSTIDMSLNHKNFGYVQSVSIAIRDTAGTLREYAAGGNLENQPITIYQAHEGMDVGDEVVLFEGIIEGPIRWDEGSRIITFDGVNRAEDVDLGIQLTSTVLSTAPYSNIPNIDPNVEDELVPMAFGSVEDVPALRMTRQFEALTASEIIINHKDSTESGVNSTYIDFRPTRENEELFYGYENITKVLIEGKIFGVTYYGIVGDYYRFDVDGTYEDGINAPKYSQDVLGSLVTGNRVHDKDYDNANVLWLAKDGYMLEGNSCCIAGSHDQWNLCVKQEGRKCEFAQPWTFSATRLPLTVGINIYILDVRAFSKAAGNLSSYDDVNASVRQTRIPAGSLALVWDDSLDYGLQNELYFVNSEGSTLTSVRSEKPQFESREPLLHEIPYQGGGSASYYTVVADWNSTGITALVLQIPLSFYSKEEWNDAIFVSQRSDVEGGTTTPSAAWGNTATIIESLIDNNGGYTSDAATFTAVKTSVANYPAGFAIFQPITLFELISEIAFQSRCILTLDGSNIKIRYISVDPAAGDLDIGADDIYARTLGVVFPETRNLVTRLRSEWRESYYEAPKFRILEQSTTTIPQRKTINFTIYNQEACVATSAVWWFHRESNLWRRVTMRCPLHTLGLELYDIVDLDLSSLLGDSFTGLPSLVECTVLASSYDHEAKQVLIELEMPIVVGATTVDTDYWNAATITRPVNPNSLDRRGYYPLPIIKAPVPHEYTGHTKVNLFRRRNADGVSSTPGDGPGGTSVHDLDSMGYDATNDEWVPQIGPGGSSTVLMQNHSHQSEENGDGGYVPFITS